MVSLQKFTTSSLSLPGEVAYITSNQMCDICICSSSTLDRWRNDLLDLRVRNFDYQMYSGVYSRMSAECLWQYCQLIRQSSYAIAQTVINKHLEVYFG